MSLIEHRKPLTFLAIAGAFLLISSSLSRVYAAVSTSYQLASPRQTGSSYSTRALMDSPRALSGDGKYAVYTAEGDDVVAGDTNGFRDVILRDTVNNTSTRVSVATNGDQADAYSWHGSISYDGNYVVFESTASNLSSGITSTTVPHVYVRDLIHNTTSLVDITSGGVVSNAGSIYPKISADGRFVVFNSLATNLVSGVNLSGVQQIYIKDLHSGSLQALSITASGSAGNKDSNYADVSCGGNVVVFASQATNLGVPTGQSGRYDLFISHIGWDKTELKAVVLGQYGIIARDFSPPLVSCDGNKVVFESGSTDIVSPATPAGYSNAYQYDRLNGAIKQVSLGNGNVQADSPQSGQWSAISMSGDGRFIAFTSYANNMDTTYTKGSDTGSSGSVYIRDMKNSTTETATILPNNHRSAWVGGNPSVSLSGDGGYISFNHATPSISNSSRSLISGFTTGVSSGTTDIYKTSTGH